MSIQPIFVFWLVDFVHSRKGPRHPDAYTLTDQYLDRIRPHSSIASTKSIQLEAYILLGR